MARPASVFRDDPVRSRSAADHRRSEAGRHYARLPGHARRRAGRLLRPDQVPALRPVRDVVFLVRWSNAPRAGRTACCRSSTTGSSSTRRSSFGARRASAVDHPEDLKGKRFAVGDYQQSAALWIRGVLQHEFGVTPQDMEWVQTRGENYSHTGASGTKPPVKLSYATQDRPARCSSRRNRRGDELAGHRHRRARSSAAAKTSAES